MALLKIRDSVNPNLWHIVPAKIIGEEVVPSEVDPELETTTVEQTSGKPNNIED